MIPLIGRVFNRSGANDVEIGQKRSVAQAMEETAAQVAYPFTWQYNTTQQSASQSYHQAEHPSPSFSTTLRSNVPQQRAQPTQSSSLNAASQSQPVARPLSAVPMIPQLTGDLANTLAVPSTGFPRPRSRSRSSRRPSRRNTPVPQEVSAGGDSHLFHGNEQSDKVRLVSIEDPAKDEAISAQALIIEQLKDKLSRTGQHAGSLQDQISVLDLRAKKAEKRLIEAERQIVSVQSNAADAEKAMQVAKQRLVEAESALEAEKLWADERVKLAEKAARNEVEDRLRETGSSVMSEAMDVVGLREIQPRLHSRGRSSFSTHGNGFEFRTNLVANRHQGSQDHLTRTSTSAAVSKTEDQNTLPMEIQTSPNLRHDAESNCEDERASYTLSRNDKGKSSEVGWHESPEVATQHLVPRPIDPATWEDQSTPPIEVQMLPSPEHESECGREGQQGQAVYTRERAACMQVSQASKRWLSGQDSTQLQEVPKPVNFRRPRAGGKRLHLVPPPPRLGDNLSNNERETDPETFEQINSLTDLALHDKLNMVLDSNRKMAEMFELLYTRGSPQSAYRPRQRADPDFKKAPLRPPRNPQRTATLKFIRRHLYELMNISGAQDILKHNDYIYPSNTPLKRAMAAFEESRTGTKPNLRPTMRVNWDTFDGKWNSELCSQFVDYLVTEKGYAGGQPTDEEHQIAVNIFWEQLERLREVVKANRPRSQETDEQTRTRTAAERKAALAKASMNSRRKNTFHERLETCLLHMQSAGIADDEKRAWQNHFTVLQELGIDGTSSDEPDDEDARVFHIKALPWRAQELTKICMQADQARNTTNAFGNRRAGNLPRTRKRRKTDRTSSRKAPAGKPINFYNPQWYGQLGRERQKKLDVQPEMELLDTNIA